MTDPEQHADALLVAHNKGDALVRVRGRGSFKVSTALKRFGTASIDKGCNRIVIDMAECVGMDSTFMGVLAGLAFRLQKREPAGKTIMMNLSSRTRGLLATLGLDHLIETHMSGAASGAFAESFGGEAAMNELPKDPGDRRTTAETMLTAHEDLVRATPENLPKFKDVLKFLREDLEREEES